MTDTSIIENYLAEINHWMGVNCNQMDLLIEAVSGINSDAPTMSKDEAVAFAKEYLENRRPEDIHHQFADIGYGRAMEYVEDIINHIYGEAQD